MLKAGIATPSKSPWASPIVLVKKKDGSTRFCTDYRKLNSITKKDVYPIPRLDDALDRLGGCKYFTSLDMASGYWQIPVAEKDRAKTAFITPDGLYEYNVMPFGLCNAGATFQRSMDRMLSEYRWEFCIVYIDDILIYSRTFDEHLRHLDLVLNRLVSAGAVIKPSKCVFASDTITYLGHIISEHGISPDEDKISGVANYPTPTNVTEVKSFVGMCSYFRKFVLQFAQIAGPMIFLTRKNVSFLWSSFQKLKIALISSPVLAHFDVTANIEVHTDASGFGLGACLIQKRDGKERPLAYASRALTGPESRYSVTEQECLAVVWAIKKFRPYLYGRYFKVVTDHCALCWLMSRKEPAGRLSRWSIVLQENNFDIVYRSGKSHPDADALSRAPVEKPTQPFDDDLETLVCMSHSPDFRYEQQRDEKLKNLIAKAEAGKQFPSSLQYMLKDGTLYRKVLMDGEDKLLLVVPKHLRHDILYACHDNPTSGHLGFWRTYQRTRTRYYWPRLLEHVRKYVRGCKHCQMRKIPREKPAGLIEAIAVGQAFEMVGIDVFGPLPKSSKGNQYIIVCTDYLTKFVETRALPAQTSNAVANFIVEQIILRHGATSRMLSDQGTPFLADLTQTVLDICQVRHLNTTAYHPQCNGLTEAFNKVLAVMLTMYVNDNHKDWDVYLPFVTSAYNTSEQATTNYTPSTCYMAESVDQYSTLNLAHCRKINHPTCTSIRKP